MHTHTPGRDHGQDLNAQGKAAVSKWQAHGGMHTVVTLNIVLIQPIIRTVTFPGPQPLEKEKAHPGSAASVSLRLPPR